MVLMCEWEERFLSMYIYIYIYVYIYICVCVCVFVCFFRVGTRVCQLEGHVALLVL